MEQVRRFFETDPRQFNDYVEALSALSLAQSERMTGR